MDPSFLNKRPAVKVVVLLAAGILLSGVIRLAPSHLFALLALDLAVAGYLYRRSVNSPWASLCFHVLLVLLGLFQATTRRVQLENDVLRPGSLGEPVELDGRVESEPVGKGSRTEMLVRATTITRRSVVYQAERRVLVQVVRAARWQNSDSLSIGDLVRISGHLESLPGARNPGDFDYGRYLALNGVQGFVSVSDTNAVSLRARSDHPALSDMAGLAQKRIYDIFDRYHKPEEASFLKGVVFGYRGDLSAEVKQSFMDTGTIHILAVSGSNVVVVGLIFFSLIGFLRVSPRIATALTLVGLLWYMVMTGLSPSVIRATIMGCAILVGSLLGRKGDIYNSLAVAALAMLLWDPLYLLDVGFQLSFAAVISIVYFYPKLEPLIAMVPERLTRYALVDGVLKLFAVSLSAQIGTLPFTAFYFGRVSLIAVLANLLVVPLSGLNTMLGFATIGFSYISGWMASCYAALNDVLVSFLLKFVMWSSKVPFAFVQTMGAGAMFTVVYYAVIVAVFNARNPRVVAGSVIILLFSLNLFLYNDVATCSASSFTVTAIDVGQGDAILLEFPNRKRVLVDTGPTYAGNDAGERLIGPLLRRKGISTLDAIILTHAHDDHVGGCRYLLENFRVRSLIVTDTAAPTKLSREGLEVARRQGVPISRIRAGESLQFDPSTRIFVLHPSSRLDRTNLNNQSIVLKTVYGASSLLLAGDAEDDVEELLVAKAGSLLTSDVLKVGHHGALTSSSAPFLKAVQPSLAVISVGRLNKFHHPSPFILSRLRDLGIGSVRTDLDGAAVLRSDGTKFSLVPWRRTSLL